MINLKVNICGVEFKNPIITASGTFGFGREYNEFYDIGRLGGICTKGLTLEARSGNASPRIAETPSGMLNSVGLQNPGVDEFLKRDMAFLKNSGSVIIANIAGKTESDYEKMAEKLSESDVDMIEMNISCPNVKAGGVAFGILPKNVENITSRVKKYCKKPLIVKLSPNVSCIADNAKGAESGGADAISLINTITGMAVDIKNRRPLLANITGGLSGPCVKPVALRMVFEAFRAVKIPVIGLGGITNFQDVLEFIMCGARAVEVGTANIMNPKACVEIIEGLENYMRLEGVKDINELCGVLKI